MRRTGAAVPFARGLSLLPRHVALGAGVFVLANGVGELLRPGFSTLGDWLSLARAGAWGAVFSAVLGVVLVWHGLSRGFGRFRWPAAVIVAAAALIACWDSKRFYDALFTGDIVAQVLVPASLPVALAFAGIAVALVRERPSPQPEGRRWLAAVTVAGVLVTLPLVRIFTFGLTRYERQADVAVVLGARAYPDGTPSLALSDRVDEAVQAYHEGLARRMIMSGGVDPDSRVSEARVMRDRAVRGGVPSNAIDLDEGGATTALSARNVAHLVPAGASVLLVTHYFHLPRTALLFRRQGLRPVTVPAHMTRHLVLEPWFVLREVPAFYFAWLAG